MAKLKSIHHQLKLVASNSLGGPSAATIGLTLYNYVFALMTSANARTSSSVVSNVVIQRTIDSCSSQT